MVCPRTDLPVGGRLALFASNWDLWPTDDFVKSILSQGYKIPFSTLPRFQGVRHTPLVGRYAPVLLEEVRSLLAKDAIEEVHGSAGEGFFSTYFLVPKKTGDLRPILNLKPINGQIHCPSFKMETLESVMLGIRPGDWIASIDLKDAYFHVPVHVAHRPYLRFAIDGRVYQYKVLPFGLSTSPRTFTKVLAPVIAFLRTRGLTVFPYLDDILFVAQSSQALSAHMQYAVDILQRAGFVINAAKSFLQPSQDLVFLGARFITAQNCVCLPEESARNIIALATRFQEGKRLPARLWMSLLGMMAAAGMKVKHARLFKRPIQLYFLSRWHRDLADPDQLIVVSPQVSLHLQWWLNLDHLLCGLPLSPVPVQAVITTDASSLGWGGVLGTEKGGSAKPRFKDAGIHGNKHGTLTGRNWKQSV